MNICANVTPCVIFSSENIES